MYLELTFNFFNFFPKTRNHLEQVIDDTIVKGALRALGLVDDHVISEVVETELVVGAVGDIGLIGLAAGDGPQASPRRILRLVVWVEEEGGFMLDAGYSYSQGVVDGPHPVVVSLGQVVINCNQMAALTAQGVEIEG